MSDDISILIPSGDGPNSLLAQTQSELPEIESLFMAVKYKNGLTKPFICGSAGDLAFAIIVLEKYLMSKI